MTLNLVASVIVRDELDRYLRWSLPALLAFCDEVRVFDDGSIDGWADRLDFGEGIDRVHVLRSEESTFFEHEGRARQSLLDWTLQAQPSHVLAIDADEFVSDGAELRVLLERRPEIPVWTLTMQEVWKAGDECVCIRQDGAWRERDIPILYRVPRHRNARHWRIPDRQLAPGREPEAVRTMARARRSATGVQILHMGWACEADRAARYARYVEHDGGRFHRDHHLQSIMWPDRRVTLEGLPWPPALEADSSAILDRIMRAPAQV